MTPRTLGRILTRQVEAHPGRGIDWHARTAGVTRGQAAQALASATSIRLVPPDVEHCRLCGAPGADVCALHWHEGGGALPYVEGR